MSSKHSRSTRQSELLRLSTNRSVVAVVVFTESRFTCFPGCQTQTTIQSHQNPNAKRERGEGFSRGTVEKDRRFNLIPGSKPDRSSLNLTYRKGLVVLVTTIVQANKFDTHFFHIFSLLAVYLPFPTPILLSITAFLPHFYAIRFLPSLISSSFSSFRCGLCGMKIEELDDVDSDRNDSVYETQIVKVDAKRALVGAGARILFYPTLLYNVLRNKMESEFRWWDEIDQIEAFWFPVHPSNQIVRPMISWRSNASLAFLLLGAVPFPKDVPRLKRLGVGGVITLNEPYETLVPSSLYLAHGIDHLLIPTRDYLFAPSLVDISRAVEFIHKNASSGRTTYVHCKAGRGRSTTIVLCYLVEYKSMTPAAALDYVRSRRPRVLLAPTQWKAVQEFSRRRPATAAYSPSGDAVLITKADLEGYHGAAENASKQLDMVHKVVRTSPMIARLSCLFASLKVSGSCGTVSRRLPVPEPRAC
ncbi:hypothetical protein F8388_003103 [Cannabis sativa]|uniref:phosphatidylglycerophosphatase n=1 Tax=Cannabis sativa TaxID=3483 RepID=A0A7J6EB19_CANSA|nr:hypothetical protein F8388_003103 [Cannabis sativa]